MSGPERDALAEKILASWALNYGHEPPLPAMAATAANIVQAHGWRPPTEPTAEPRVPCWCLNRHDGRVHEFLPGRGVGLCGAQPTEEPTAERAGDADDVATVLAAHVFPGDITVALTEAWIECPCGERVAVPVENLSVSQAAVIEAWARHVAQALASGGVQ